MIQNAQSATLVFLSEKEEFKLNCNLIHQRSIQILEQNPNVRIVVKTSLADVSKSIQLPCYLEIKQQNLNFKRNLAISRSSVEILSQIKSMKHIEKINFQMDYFDSVFQIGLISDKCLRKYIDEKVDTFESNLSTLGDDNVITLHSNENLKRILNGISNDELIRFLEQERL